mmetsp:Transcript_15808/g.26503  ORF Transcript_15808/g.26503 Transcript_15808/m.26503 type:complete len:481 (+) Transcript_15808:116-1558(+)
MFNMSETEKALYYWSRPVLIVICAMLLFNLPTLLYKCRLFVRGILYLLFCHDKKWKIPEDPGLIFAPLMKAQGDSGSGSGSGTVSGTVRTASASASAATTTGLDFSSLLAAGNNNSGAADYAAAAAAVAAGGGLNFSNFLGSAAAAGGTGSSGYPAPVYYPGMSLDDAMMHNRHPRSFVEVLFGNNENNKNNESSLVKELNYHQPLLAAKLRASVQKNRNNNNDLTEATTIWRDELTKGSIRGAMAQTDRRMTEQSMTQKLNDDPGSQEAKDYFQQQKNQSLIAEQYRNAMDEFPESMGKILMLYIDTVVNGHAVQAFVDSGAQSTIMTKQTAALCGIDHLIDTRFAGQAVGVGTGIILGRIHLAQMKIGQAFFPITITVMEKMSSHNDMKFLLGLDNLKRFTCAIDLEQNVLRFKIGQEYMTTPFLHEKDLGEDKGGTQGFDAEKANQELMELRQKRAAADDDDGNRRKKKDDDEPMEE